MATIVIEVGSDTATQRPVYSIICRCTDTPVTNTTTRLQHTFLPAAVFTVKDLGRNADLEDCRWYLSVNSPVGLVGLGLQLTLTIRVSRVSAMVSARFSVDYHNHKNNSGELTDMYPVVVLGLGLERCGFKYRPTLVNCNNGSVLSELILILFTLKIIDYRPI